MYPGEVVLHEETSFGKLDCETGSLDAHAQGFFANNFSWPLLALQFAVPQVHVRGSDIAMPASASRWPTDAPSAWESGLFAPRRERSPHSNLDAQAGHDHLTYAPAGPETYRISSRSSCPSHLPTFERLALSDLVLESLREAAFVRRFSEIADLALV